MKWIQSVFPLARRVASVSLQSCARHIGKEMTCYFLHAAEYFLPLWATSVSLSQCVFVLAAAARTSCAGVARRQRLAQ